MDEPVNKEAIANISQSTERSQEEDMELKKIEELFDELVEQEDELRALSGGTK